MPGHVTDILILAAGLLVGVAGALVLLAALLRDRARGRRRCPKCWYEMTGVPGMTCPECGRTAKKEKRLFRTRRRWGRAALGMLVLLIGIGTALTPTVRRHGAYRLLPSGVLVHLTPPIEEAYQAPTGLGPVKLHPVLEELVRRIEGPRGLARWEWGVMLRRLGVVRAPAVWPVDQPLQVSVNPPSFVGDNVWATVKARLPDAQVGGAQRGMLRAGTIDLRTRSVTFEVQVWRAPPHPLAARYPLGPGGWERVCETTLTLRVRGVTSADLQRTAAKQSEE